MRHSYEWQMTSDEAETVTCPTCGAQPRERCVNGRTGDLTNYPAHHDRIRAAKEER